MNTRDAKRQAWNEGYAQAVRDAASWRPSRDPGNPYRSPGPRDDESVERVARALYEAAGLPTAWALIEGQETWRRLASVALAAALSVEVER